MNFLKQQISPPFPKPSSISIYFHLFLLISIYFYLSFPPSLFAQSRLNVPDNLIGKRTLYLEPGSAPAGSQEGQLYYDSTTNTIKYYDGVDWNNLDLGLSADRTVATRIVAASNSLGTVAGANPKADYVCDGTADQEEIQLAINDLPVSGGVVYLLEGTYNISAAINLDNTAPDDSNKSIIGAGRATVLRATGGVNLINASSVAGILISQLTLDGNSVGQNGISLDTVTNAKIDNLWIERMTQDGMRLSSSSDNTILNNQISSNGWQGIELLSSSNNNHLSQCIILANGIGIYLVSSQNNIISTNHLQANVWFGIGLWSSSNNNSLLANNLQANGAGGIWQGDSSNNIISENNLQANSGPGLGIYFFGLPANSNSITGNNFNLNNQHGVLLSGSSSNIISGNLFSDNGGSGAFDGIRIENNADSNIISSNRLRDDLLLGPGYGINLQASTCDNNYLVTNLIDGPGYLDTATPPTYDRRILDLGTNTRYTDKQKLTLERQEVSVSAGSQLDAAASPRGYVVFNTGGGSVTLNSSTAIINGRAIGDLLILEGSPSGSVTINDGANTQLGGAMRSLSAQDTLKLLWNGVDWIELSYSDN